MVDKKQIIGYGILMITVLSLGFVWRVDGMQRHLEYDELWALKKFANDTVWETLVCRDFPSYHPISHTIAGIYAKQDYVEEAKYRQWHLVAGFLLLIFVALYTFNITSSYEFSILATALCALDPYLIHYSHTARGYTLQHFSTILLFYWLFNENIRKKSLFLWGSILVLILVLLQLSMVTSILIWAPLVGVFAIYEFLQFKQEKISFRQLFKQLVPIIIGGLAICLWFLAIYKGLLAGTDDKVPYESWWLLPVDLIKPLLWVPLHFFWIIGLYCARKSDFFWPMISVIATALLFVLVTRLLGPIRVHTYLIPLLYIFLAYGLYRGIEIICEKYGRTTANITFLAIFFLIISVFQLLLPKALYRIEGPDYKTVVPKLVEQTNDYLLFPTWDGLLVSEYYPKINTANSSLLLKSDKVLNILLVNQKQKHLQIPVCHANGRNKKMFSFDNGVIESLVVKGVLCRRVSAHRITSLPQQPQGILLATIIARDKKQYQHMLDLTLNQSVWYNANLLSTRPTYIANENGVVIQVVAYLLVAPIQSEQDWQEATSLLPKANYYWLQR